MGTKRTDKLIPVNIGVANAIGVIPGNARADHVHNHPAGLGTDLHHNEIHVLDPGTGPHTGLPTFMQVRDIGPNNWNYGAGGSGNVTAVSGTITKVFADTKLHITASAWLHTAQTVAAYTTFDLRITIAGAEQGDSVQNLRAAWPHGIDVTDEGDYLTTSIVIDGLAAGNHLIALNLNIVNAGGQVSSGQFEQAILTVAEVF